MAPRTRKNQSKKKQQPTEKQQPAEEAAGQGFQRLSAALAAEQELGAGHAAVVGELQTEATELRAELARLEARLAQAERAAQGSQTRRGQLGQELERLKPRLGYEFNLPQDASLAVIGLLGKARCRAAMSCRGLRAAVGSAKHLGAFKHEVLSLAAGTFYDADEDMTYGHSAVCTGDAVFGFGSGVQGQLGYAAVSQPTPRVVKALLDEDVVAVAASDRSTLVCTAQSQVYWFGRLEDMDDRVIIESKVPRLVGGLERVVGVAAGRQHLLAWTTRSGQLYTWGWGLDCQLGHGRTGDEAAPRLVEGLAGQQVVGADGGAEHSVACTASGRVYTFGWGKERLGHGQDAADYQSTPRVVEGLAGSMVVAVAAGTEFTAAVTEAGELYTWGQSEEGELGHGEEEYEESLPRLVAGLVGKRVAGVAAGGFHMLAWTHSGELYSWGCGVFGQLGHDSTQCEWSPRRVEALVGKAVVGAAAGSDHSVVATREQKVYTFGEDTDGGLGHGAEATRTRVPKEVVGLRV